MVGNPAPNLLFNTWQASPFRVEVLSRYLKYCAWHNEGKKKKIIVIRVASTCLP